MKTILCGVPATYPFKYELRCTRPAGHEGRHGTRGSLQQHIKLAKRLRGIRHHWVQWDCSSEGDQITWINYQYVTRKDRLNPKP